MFGIFIFIYNTLKFSVDANLLIQELKLKIYTRKLN